MKLFFTIPAVMFLLSQIAGQIYLVSLGIKITKVCNIFVRIIVGIITTTILNIPAITISILNPTMHNLLFCLPSPVPIIFLIWYPAISVFGLIWFIRDYWLKFRRKGKLYNRSAYRISDKSGSR
jgi:hypothetical protein